MDEHGKPADWDNTILVARVPAGAGGVTAPVTLGSLNGPRGSKTRTAIIEEMKGGRESGSVTVDGVEYRYYSQE